MHSDVKVLQVEIGQRIRKHRKRMKITQAELAKRLNLSANYVAHLERGSRGSSLETLVTLSRVFRCPVRRLLP